MVYLHSHRRVTKTEGKSVFFKGMTLVGLSCSRIWATQIGLSRFKRKRSWLKRWSWIWEELGEE